MFVERFLLTGLRFGACASMAVLLGFASPVAAALLNASGESGSLPFSRSAPAVDIENSSAASEVPLPVLLAYSVLIVAASLAGGWIPGRLRLTHTRFQLLISFVGGLMLGIATLHLWPHALHELGSQGADRAAHWTMAGILVMFLLLRAFHVHRHEIDSVAEQHPSHGSHQHDHDHDLLQTTAAPGPVVMCQHDAHSSRFGWIGVFLGLGIHSLLDGVALAAAMQAEADHAAAAHVVGLGAFLAVALHKPLDSLSITTVLLASGWSNRARLLINMAFAGLCPLGAAAFLFGIDHWSGPVNVVIGCGLAFSAGMFLCISLSDLLPEMQFHSHHRLRLTAALLLGVALAWAIGLAEPEHLHGGPAHAEARPPISSGLLNPGRGSA